MGSLVLNHFPKILAGVIAAFLLVAVVLAHNGASANGLVCVGAAPGMPGIWAYAPGTEPTQDPGSTAPVTVDPRVGTPCTDMSAAPSATPSISPSMPPGVPTPVPSPVMPTP